MDKVINSVVIILVTLTITELIIIIKLTHSLLAYKPKMKLKRTRINRGPRYLSIEMLDGIDGIQFEDICIVLLIAQGFKDFSKTSTTGDFGIDIICHKGKKSYGIQCKCYTGTVGVSAIEEVYAGSAFYACDIPIVMTNSRFTDAACVMAKELHVELLSRSDLTTMIQTYNNTAKRVERNVERGRI